MFLNLALLQVAKLWSPWKQWWSVPGKRRDLKERNRSLLLTPTLLTRACAHTRSHTHTPFFHVHIHAHSRTHWHAYRLTCTHTQFPSFFIEVLYKDHSFFKVTQLWEWTFSKDTCAKLTHSNIQSILLSLTSEGECISAAVNPYAIPASMEMHLGNIFFFFANSPRWLP